MKRLNAPSAWNLDKLGGAFVNVVSIPKTNESFRILYDTKGRFRLHSLRDEEAKFKLTSTPMMAAPSATQTHSSRPTTPSS
ncbi:Ribosomal protein S4e, central [Artemisia annua]|uniref:Ribosomal protein S4e, central n=1 Tax=Artemisia annua TaxID=35608 RepID=A0A2U1QKR5_ARTAN|nr:Ribosomal protein S4e, central [Artemisia annua]